MSHVLNLVIFLGIAGAMFYFIIKGLSKLSDRQQKQFEDLMKQELRNNFESEAFVLEYDKEYPPVDTILSSLVSPAKGLFKTNRTGSRPKRIVTEGKDNDKAFLAAIVKSVRFQSGGPVSYTFIYAVKDVEIKNEDLLNQSSNIRQVGEWLATFKDELLSGGYKISENRFKELKNQLYLVIE